VRKLAYLVHRIIKLLNIGLQLCNLVLSFLCLFPGNDMGGEKMSEDEPIDDVVEDILALCPLTLSPWFLQCSRALSFLEYVCY